MDTETERRLAASVCGEPGVAFAVTFGSRVSDASHAGSDLDLAVKFTDRLSADERLCRLSGQVQADDVPFVDLSDIERLPPGVAAKTRSRRFAARSRRDTPTGRTNATITAGL